MLNSLFLLLIFPGFLFLSVFGTYAEFVDRKIYARLQNRVGPPWFQPFADFVKLLAKEDIVPECAVPGMFRMMPVFALAATTAAFCYIPIWSTHSLYPFRGDVIVVLYLLTIPTVTFFLGGWYSTSLFARIGSVRALTQLFAYEVPLFMSILAAALLANTWSLTDITLFYSQHPSYAIFNIIGFVVSLLALLGKLEKTPFDIPEAETEIVAGTFTEYSGRLYALFHLTVDIEMVVGSALIAAVFLPFGLTLGPIAGFILFVIKVLFLVGLMTLLRTVVARLRIDQMVNFCWKFMAPLALLQILINLILKGVL
jgi:NADH-quinone oxidoreductase subunit H